MSDVVTASPEQNAPVRSRRGRRILGVILIVLLLLLGLATYLLFQLITPPGAPSSGADTRGLTWVRSIYGMSNAPEDQFQYVQAAVPDLDGSIIVVDGIHQSLMRFTPDGRFVEQSIGPDDAPLFTPSRFAVGPDGTFYICETMSDVVRVIGPDNTEQGSFLIPRPVSVAVSEDRIVVGSVSGFAILDLEGNPLHIIGSRGDGDNQFDYVHGVAIGDDGSIYVADSFNNRLSKYDGEGNRIWMVNTGAPTNSAEMVNGSLSITGSGEATGTTGPLQLPLGLTLDGAGRVVVIDMFECALVVFDPEDGSFIGSYGDAGADDGFFFYPVSVSYDAERDWFTVADYLNNRAQIVRLPDSSGGGDAAAALRRALTGPLRACGLPLLLLLIVIVWTVVRSIKNKRAQKSGSEPDVV